MCNSETSKPWLEWRLSFNYFARVSIEKQPQRIQKPFLEKISFDQSFTLISAVWKKKIYIKVFCLMWTWMCISIF